MVKLGTVAVDGTKIKANANRHKAMSHGRMQTTETELMAQMADLVKKAASTDEAERDEPKNEWALNAFACHIEQVSWFKRRRRSPRKKR